MARARQRSRAPFPKMRSYFHADPKMPLVSSLVAAPCAHSGVPGVLLLSTTDTLYVDQVAAVTMLMSASLSVFLPLRMFVGKTIGGK